MSNLTTDEKVLLMIVNGKKGTPAPTKQTRTPDHTSYIFGIGEDNYAELIVHNDAIKALKDLED